MPNREELQDLINDYFEHYIWGAVPKSEHKTLRRIDFDELIDCLSFEIWQFIREEVSSNGSYETPVCAEGKARIFKA